MASLFRSSLVSTLLGVLAALAAPGIAALSAGAAHAADTPEPPPSDPTARAEWLSAQAETAFSEKRFADAIRLYLDAWEAAPAASILYNVAFIYDKRLNELELAIDYYDRAATSSDADGELKTKAKARIAALRVELAKARPKDPPPTVKKKKKRDVNLAPWIVVGSGGALLTGGIVVGLMASGTESDFQAARNVDDKRALQSDGRTQALVADLLMGAGIVAIGTGVVWAILDGGSDDGEGTVGPVDSSGLVLEPQLIPGGAALVVGGRL